MHGQYILFIMNFSGPFSLWWSNNIEHYTNIIQLQASGTKSYDKNSIRGHINIYLRGSNAYLHNTLESVELSNCLSQNGRSETHTTQSQQYNIAS